MNAEVVIARDVATDPVAAPVRDLMLAHGFHAGWSYPIRDSEGSCLGTFAVTVTEAREPEPRESEAFHRAASLAAIALEKAAGEEQRHRAEIELQAAEQHYRRLVMTAPQTIYALDSDGDSWS